MDLEPMFRPHEPSLSSLAHQDGSVQALPLEIV
jgi:hypothetical protein